MTLKKKNVLFVGSFISSGKDGSVGGQMFACRSLIQSELSDKVNWILLDSTADSNIIAPLFLRGLKAGRRCIIFLFHLIFSRVDTVLIFTADGASFVEKGSMLLLAKLFGKRSILAPRSGIVIEDIKNSSFMRKFIPHVLKKADLIICQAETWKKFYAELISSDDDKFVVIQNWIDPALYFQINKENISKDIHVLFLSWVDANKGIFDLIKASAMIKNKKIEVTYHIAGDGNAMKKAMEEVGSNHLQENYKFHGWANLEKKIELLKVADIYVLPSYFEGFPNSLMEAMAAGKAVVATNVGAIPDMILNDNNGMIYEAGKVNELSATLDMLIHNSKKRTDLGNNARETIKRNNTIDIAVSKFEEIL